MANIIEIASLDIPELKPYTDTSELSLKNCGIFVAESPKVIRTAIDSGYKPVSFLAERKYISGQASDIIEKCGDVPVYTADSDILTKLTGFRMTQGILSVMERKPDTAAEDIIHDAERIAVFEDIMNQNNLGALFRSAAALNFDAVLFTSGCTDPLFRRCVRVSMGTVFRVPWAYIGNSENYMDRLKKSGFKTAAMALRSDTVKVNDPHLAAEKRLAVILGTEGDGLRESTITASDYTIKIPMAHGIDSLNVAAAGAIAFWHLGRND